MTNKITIADLLAKANYKKGEWFDLADGVSVFFEIKSATEMLASEASFRNKIEKLTKEESDNDVELVKLYFNTKYFSNIKDWKNVKYKHIIPDCDESEKEIEVEGFSKKGLEVFLNENIESLGILLTKIEEFLNKDKFRKEDKKYSNVEQKEEVKEAVATKPKTVRKKK